MNSHPKFVPTLMQLRNLAWWSDMQTICREYLDQCADLLAERDPMTEVGLGIVSHKKEKSYRLTTTYYQRNNHN